MSVSVWFRGIAAFMLLSGAALIPGCDSAVDSRLDRPAVERLLDDLDRAIARQDVGGVGARFADDARITLAVADDGVLTLDKGDYIERLRTGFASASDYEYTRAETHIELGEHRRQAVVTAQTRERLVLDGEEHRLAARIRARVESSRDGAHIVSLRIESQPLGR